MTLNNSQPTITTAREKWFSEEKAAGAGGAIWTTFYKHLHTVSWYPAHILFLALLHRLALSLLTSCYAMPGLQCLIVTAYIICRYTPFDGPETMAGNRITQSRTTDFIVIQLDLNLVKSGSYRGGALGVFSSCVTVDASQNRTLPVACEDRRWNLIGKVHIISQRLVWACTFQLDLAGWNSRSLPWETLFVLLH